MSFVANCWGVAPTLLATEGSGTYGGFAPILSVIDSSAQWCDMVRRFIHVARLGRASPRARVIIFR